MMDLHRRRGSDLLVPRLGQPRPLGPGPTGSTARFINCQRLLNCARYRIHLIRDSREQIRDREFVNSLQLGITMSLLAVGHYFVAIYGLLGH